MPALAECPLVIELAGGGRILLSESAHVGRVARLLAEIAGYREGGHVIRDPSRRPLKVMFDYVIHHRPPCAETGDDADLPAGELAFEPRLNGRGFPPLLFTRLA